MNVSLKNIDAVSGIVKLEIVKADYAEQVEKSLRNFRQKANVPGFRKGMVPMGMVKKMYGKHVLAEEVNKLVSENLFNYIRDNKLNILGEPMPNETEQQPINFDTQEDFEFCFDVALAPEIKIELSKNDKLPYYQVAIDEEMMNQQVDAYTANFGAYDQVEEVEEKDMVKGTVAELENGSPKEGGIVVEDAVLMPSYMKDEAEKAKFIGAKTNSVIVFNPNKAYEGAEAEIASFLKVDKEAVAGITGDFSFEISEITRHKKAELNQELFDKVFGEGVVTSEEEFKNKIKEALAEQFVPQSDFKFLLDAREILVQKAGELQFADGLLKRWLLAANEKNTPEKLDEEYPQIIEDLKYQLIKENLVKGNNLKVEDADIESFAKRVAKAQFAQYGMLSVPEEVLANYAKDMLKNKQTLQNIIDRAVEEKLAAWLKEQVELDVKEVSAEEFNKLFE
ncbi:MULTISPECIES: trigger factor [Parabacteroides]|jgi:trigger factor|uniref:Trigger factor n=1 Tax=Parabacteroides faecis TaxID=1217282 RepID=A0ABR6KU09_9BACT|nr:MULTISPECIES: trigger factor [Parabacteroides]MBB4624874.1 trigger factor [Parabacteroides faecis]MBC8620955.1 trigger factor [Parabacteroides faecis]RHR37657.1 trigger factor [Parabacteroides sp. AF18-52]RHR96488.1 trigger factor [Parabacteroides sp. AF14-59]GGK14838.1 trigger factor [Parabacteroides faecis]